jgi:hypothetical protein
MKHSLTIPDCDGVRGDELFLFAQKFRQLGRRSPAGLLLEVDIRQRLAATVAHHEASGLFFDVPGRREAAG